MIPHILFHSEQEKSYFPNYDFWDSSVNAGAPASPKSSGITQPPVHGFVLESIWKLHRDNEQVRDFVKELIPKVIDAHKFWYTFRDPGREGLVCIYHPWESGRDNSPLWDGVLDNIDLSKSGIPEYRRKDTSLIDADQRPTKKQYDQYVHLLLLGKKYRYEAPEILRDSDFVIQDTLINACLIRSNESLLRLGEEFGFSMEYIEERQQESRKQYDAKLWHEELGIYCCYDLKNQELLAHREIGGFASLFAGIPPPERARLMNNLLYLWHDEGYILCPSFDVASPHFDSKRYWRGPVWPITNWLLYHGLKRYGFDKMASVVRDDFIDLVQRQGFSEYFEPDRTISSGLHEGYGGKHFSWTASCFIDLILSE
jgi:hypothetical protein